MKRGLADRFWDKVAVGGECWTWTGCVDKDGYGTMWVDEKGRARRAHRVSWELQNGPVPPGLCVLHRCDNPPCVRPAHLFVGTNLDNQRDMIAKGRASVPFGSSHANSRLNEEMVAEGRRLVAAKVESVLSLARRAGVHPMVMRKAIQGITWRHVPRPE